MSVQRDHARLVGSISDGCDPLDLRVTIDPHVENQDTVAPRGYLCGFLVEA
ncbi:hypothetical protein MESS2_1670009 [Mesorhizobium metallidurans STM 2683]|uniref:Uncharacterized protein n=1 Tax=Mesorhizobium metallidurans STM 2683 TaxID=1297569 RepID=M5ENN8_9HYPH|nr:hypothetical protein MESS2_1670009 [Mesorhizobium metallidurans STM 2683]